MKRLLFLGAARFQCPALAYAREAGYHVITVDNMPQNPGHRLAHESHCVSTVDREGVLALAVKCKIDGVLAFASDVGASTASYVSAKLGLPGVPIDVIDRLTNKAQFRDFLARERLQSIKHLVVPDVQRLEEAMAFCASLDWQVVVKPVDSSGSKGVSILTAREQFVAAISHALHYSRSGSLIVEERIVKKGSQVCGDGYMENGRIRFVEFGDGHFYPDGPPAPWGESFPSTHEQAAIGRLSSKIEEVLHCCGYQRGPFNLDAFITDGLEPFIIELGPRSGGNFIPTAIRHRTQVDLVAAAVEGALAADYQLPLRRRSDEGFYACYMVHSRRSGVFDSIEIAPGFPGVLVEENHYVEKGAVTPEYRQGNEFIANVIFSFHTAASMNRSMITIHEYCRPRFQQ